MKRVMFYKPRDIRVESAQIPAPGPGEVVIKNKVTLTCGTDVKTYMRGYRYEPPFAMGHEASGIIYAVGQDVDGFKEGDRVVAHNSAPCNVCYYCKKGQPSMCPDLIQNQFTNGAYAQYQKIPAAIVKQNMFHIPEGMNYKQAALLEPLACAVYGAGETVFELGDTVVVNGCGPIGLMFVRMCYLKGARVIATDLSDMRLDKARKMGAAEIVNVKGVENQAEVVRALTIDRRGADAAIEAAGLPEVWNSSIEMVRPGGFVTAFGGTKKGLTIPVDTYKLHYEQLTIKGVFHTTPKHVNAAFEMLKMNAISEKDFIQNEYPLEDVEKAILEHASGEVIKNAIVYDD